MRSTAGRSPDAGGSVGRLVSGSHSVPTERPASFSPSHAAQSNPNASMATYPCALVQVSAGTAVPVSVADHAFPAGTTCIREPSS